MLLEDSLLIVLTLPQYTLIWVNIPHMIFIVVADHHPL